MLKIGLIKEGKVPADNRVALIPAQCKWIKKHLPGVDVVVESSASRCFADAEYIRAGITVTDDVSGCDLLLGIKEVPQSQLLADKTYMFFSHTRKKQTYNQEMIQHIAASGITLIDYECMEHDDGQRIIGFGFFAGVVGAHNGMMAYGQRTGLYQLGRVYKQRSFRDMIHNYFGLRLPNVKVLLTGSGRVTHGVLEIMNLMGIHEVEPEDYLKRRFAYPVYTQLKGAQLYRHKQNGGYSREHFHENAATYECLFHPYASQTDILMNGVYWDETVPRLFEKNEVKNEDFIIQTIADITDDKDGSVPVNLGDQTIEDPVYGVDRHSFEKTAPYLPGSIDVMAVGNLPNELPRDASKYFGEQLIKYILPDFINGGSAIIDRATIIKNGLLTQEYEYLRNYVYPL